MARLANPADQAAWDEFVSSYQPAVYGYCRSRGLQNADAIDVVQDVLMVVHRKIGEWRPSGRRNSFRFWLLRTAHRMCLKAIRERDKNGAVGGTTQGEQLDGIAARSEPPEATELDWERWAFGWAAEQVRPEIGQKQWDSFWFTAVLQIPVEEVARRLGIRVGSIYTNKCRVMAKIRQRAQQLTRSEQ